MEHKLYVIEGLDGSGKATQATLLTLRGFALFHGGPLRQLLPPLAPGL